MKKRVASAPPKSGDDRVPSQALLDELSALESVLEQDDGSDEPEQEKSERASDDDQRD
ncbi:MAG: hypothetical protein RQ729_09405 [Wenzhouxiangellaceae bacterium]|nr:hypothetical protein [Wenzhouxiangellaceae bacterium]